MSAEPGWHSLHTGRCAIIVRCRSLFITALCCAAVVPLRAQTAPAPGADRDGEARWFIGIAPGYGRLRVDSDLGAVHAQGAFTLPFRVGRRLGDRLTIGVELVGWLIAPYDYNDPAKGASVSEATLFARFRPSARVPLFVEAGGGAASYTNHAPDAFDATGTGWWAGVGWTHRVRDGLRVVPSAHWSGGRFRDTRNVLIQRTGFRFDAWDLRLGAELALGSGMPRTGRHDAH